MILWFSGTGNSRYVAERLAAQLVQPQKEMRPELITRELHIPSAERDIIWVCPVYSWGIPPYVRSVIKDIRFERDGNEDCREMRHHLVLTCGDDCGLAPEMWRKEISKREWTGGKAFSVTMPNNYVCMKGFDVDSKEVEKAKLSAATARIDEISRAFNDSEGEALTDVVRGRFAWIKTRIIYPWFVRHAMSPKPFRFTKGCISCGKCAAACPMRNISMEIEKNVDDGRQHPRKRPRWSDNCAMCLACYHVCPRHAVMYGKSTLNKGQYVNPKV